MKRSFTSRGLALALITLLVAVWGAFSLDYGAAPPPGAGWLSVIVEHFGVDPLEMERTITIPLEDELSSLSGIAQLRSYTDIGRSRVEVLLEDGTNPNEAFLSVRDAAYRVYERLPQSVQRPRIARSTQNAETALLVGFQDPNRSLRELRTWVEREVEPLVKSLPDSGEVTVVGGRIPEIQVAFDRDRGAVAGLSPADLAQYVQQSYVYGGVGSVQRGTQEHVVSVEGRIEKPSDLEQILVVRDQQTVPLNAFATVAIASRDPETIGRFNASEQVGVAVTLAAGGNIARLSASAPDILDAARESGVQATIIVDRGADIIRELYRAALSFGVAFLALFVPLALLLRSWRASFLSSALLIPILIVTLGVLGWLGATVDASLIAGLTIGLGLVLDPMITILLSSTELESRQLNGPIIAGGLTTILALAPLAIVLSHVAGSLQLAAGIAAAVAASVGLAVAARRQLSSISVSSLSFRTLRTAAAFSLRHPVAFTIAWIVVLATGTAAALRLPIRVDSGPTESTITGRFEMSSGTAVDAVDRELGRFAAEVLRLPAVERIQTTARRDSGTFSVEVAATSRDSVRSDIMRISLDNSDAFVFLPSGIADDQLSAEVTIVGPDLEELVELTRAAASAFTAEEWVTQIVLHFKEPPDELLVRPLYDRLAQAGTDPQQLGNHLRRIVYGPVAIKWRDGQTDIDLRVLAPETKGFDTSRLLAISIPSGNDSQIRLSDVASVDSEQATGRIQRTDRQRSLSFSITASDNDVRLLQSRLTDKLDSLSFPAGYGWQVDRSLERQLEQANSGWTAVLIALALIVCVLVVQFESIARSMVVVMTVPFAMAPSLVALWLLGWGMTTPALMGMVVAAGIAVNNVILILARGGRASELLGAVRKRLPAMVISTATTAVGALPLIVISESDNLAAVGVVVFVSVLSSLLVSVTLLPAASHIRWRRLLRAHHQS